jgi:hypothetical protein
MLAIVKTTKKSLPVNHKTTGAEIVFLEITIEKIARTDLKRAHEIISRSKGKTTRNGTRYFKTN